MPLSLIPESAPFDADQRAWLNGFFAGLLGVPEANGNGHATQVADANSSVTAILAPATPTNGTPAKAAEEEDFAWHDPALPMDERMELAVDQPVERRLMAAMAQLDCGACGYVCKTYSEAIASGEERSLRLCSPGGSNTAKMLKSILKEKAGKNGSATRNGKPHTKIVSPTALASENGQPRQYDRKNPLIATLVSSTNLNKEGSAKDTGHVVIDLSESELTYDVGDSLGVYPTNCLDLVDRILDTLRVDGGRRLSLRETLLTRDLRNFEEELVLLLAETANESDADQLRTLAEDDDRMSTMDVLDLLEMAASARVDFEHLVSALAPLAPRLYSIASSLKAHPNQVHLTIAKATVMVGQRLRKGVASTMFADRIVPGERVPVFVQASHGFRVPTDGNTPIIMVGPGTGVAPFRAFLQERKASGAQGAAWMFFGDQHRETDFLYESELSAYLADGTLTRLDTAFSRDQQAKIYVQDRLRENGAELYRWLERGANFYVCGDAKRMAFDVDRALHEVVARHGGISPEDAKAYVAELSRSKRYLRDVY